MSTLITLPTNSPQDLEEVLRIHPDRPILHHLNADSSWLLQLPHPYPNSARRCYNILIDPWLSGSQVDYFPWFSEQWHGTPSACSSIAAVEDVARQSGDDQVDHPIDLVIISHEFTDHCHRATLTQLPASTSVFASAKAASMIRKWRHFDIVETTSDLEQEQGALSGNNALPEWLRVSRITSGFGDVGTLHSALCIAFRLEAEGYEHPLVAGEGWECIVYTPHGISATALQTLPKTIPQIKTLALLHGIYSVRVGLGMINLGAKNGAEVRRLLRAKYWMPTHDEDKEKKGVVAMMMRKWTPWPTEAKEREKTEGFLEVTNGYAVLLI